MSMGNVHRRMQAALDEGKTLDFDASAIKIDGTAVTASAAELNIMDGVTATAAELNRAADVSARIVNVTASTLTVAVADHEGKVVTINAAAGCDATLPAATGSGAHYRFFIGTTVTSNDVTFVTTGGDVLCGVIVQANDGGATANVYETSTATTITLNGSTKGGIKGDQFEFIDVATDTWWMHGRVSSTGTEVTPLS